jgi:hypothetical protein
MLATLQVELESLGLSAERVSEVLDQVGPEINNAIDKFDDTVDGWQSAAAEANINIDKNPNLTDQEKRAIQKRVLPDPGNAEDFPVGSNASVEISRGRVRSRDERLGQDRAYGSQRAREILAQQYPDMAKDINNAKGMPFAHLPGSESILSDIRPASAPTVGTGKNKRELTAEQEQELKKIQDDYSRIKVEDASRSGTAQANAEWTAYKEEKDKLSASQDGKSSKSFGKIDPEKAAAIKDEAKKIAIEQEKALGVSSGMAGPGAFIAPPKKPQMLVTGEQRMTAEQAAVNNAVGSGMRLRSEMSTPFTNRLGAGLENAAEKLKAKFPKYADKFDAGILSLQRKIDLDGSFADQEEKKRQLALQAQQKLTDAMNERAARVSAGEKGVPEVDKKLLLDKEELAAITSEEVRQKAAIQKEDKRQRRQQLAGKVMGAGFAVTTALGIASSMGGPVGEFAQQAMPVAGAASTILPMLIAMGPVLGTVVGLLGAMAAGIMLYNAELEKNRKKGVEFAESLGNGKKDVDEFAEFAGRASASQIMDKRRENQMSPFAIQTGEKTYGQSYVESEQGKAKLEAIKLNIDESSTELAATRFATQLSLAVSEGVMDVAQARSMAAALGVELENREFTTNVIAQVNQLVGPNGENLLDGGLKVQLDIIDRAQEELDRPNREREEANSQIEEMNQKLQESYQRQQQILKLLEDQTLSEKERIKLVNEYNALNSESIQMTQERDKLEAKNTSNAFKSAFSAAVQVTQTKQNLELIQEVVDSNEVYYQKLIDQAVAMGDINKAHELEKKLIDGKVAILQKQIDLYNGIDELVAADGFNDQETFTSQKESIKKRYEGTTQAIYVDEATEAVKNFGFTGTDDEQEAKQVKIMTMLDTGAVDPQTIGNILNIFKDDEDAINATLAIGTEMAPADADMIFQMSEMFKTDKEQARFLYRFEDASPEEKESLKDTFAFIQKLETSDQDLQWTMEFYNDPKNDAVLKKTQKALKDLEQTPDVTVDVITQLTGASPEYLNGVVDWFNGLPEEQQKVFTSVFTSIYNTVGDRANNEAYQTWLETQTGMTDSEAAFGQYAAEIGRASCRERV